MSDLTELWDELSALKLQMSRTIFQAPVEEYKDGKFRLKLGEDKDGKPVLSQWMSDGGERGFTREEVPKKKGQNMLVLAPGGNMRGATAIPQAPSDELKYPDHRDDKARTRQTGEVKTTEKEDSIEWEIGEVKLTIDKKGVHLKYGEQVFELVEAGVKAKTKGVDWKKG